MPRRHNVHKRLCSCKKISLHGILATATNVHLSVQIRLCGFSYSVRHVGAAQKFAGPYVHMSPERLLGLDCGFASDSWSVGILAMEALCGKVCVCVCVCVYRLFVYSLCQQIKYLFEHVLLWR